MCTVRNLLQCGMYYQTNKNINKLQVKLFHILTNLDKLRLLGEAEL